MKSGDYIFLIMLIRSLTIFFTFSTAMPIQASVLQENWWQFYQQGLSVGTVALAHSEIAKYPKELLTSSIQYPDFVRYTWQDLTQLYQIRKTCIANRGISEHLKASAEFELRICGGQLISTEWFASQPLRHPAGGSFAERYLANMPQAKNRDSLEHLLTGDNSMHPLYDTFSGISPEGRDALLNGNRAWLSGDTLWLNGEDAWLKLPSHVWQALAKKLDINLQAEHCGFRYTNLCLAQRNNSNQVLTITSILACFVLAALLTLTYHQKRVQRETKKLSCSC